MDSVEDKLAKLLAQAHTIDSGILHSGSYFCEVILFRGPRYKWTVNLCKPGLRGVTHTMAYGQEENSLEEAIDALGEQVDRQAGRTGS